MNLPSQSQHPARKKPIQERGQQKYELLLAATAALLEEQGYEAVTTKAIAASGEDPTTLQNPAGGRGAPGTKGPPCAVDRGG